MGGIGSGHTGYAKPLTNTAIRIDLRCEPFRSALSEVGAYIVRWSRGGESVGAMIVASVLPVNGKPTALVVPLALSAAATWPVVGPTAHLQLTWRPCPFGGHRAYVQCGRCSRQAVVLFLARGSWCCRQCAGVIHPSTRQGDYDRHMAKLAGVRRKMGYQDWRGDGWTIPAVPGRRMRGSTWRHLVDQAKREQRAMWEAYERDSDGYIRSLNRLLSGAFGR